MNFQDLFRKIAELDQPVTEAEKKADKDYDGDGKVETGEEEYKGSKDKAIKKAMSDKKVDEDLVDECGGMMPSSSLESPKQQDSVTMSVSMNGSGAGGIADLLSVLRKIEDGGSSSGPDEMDVLIKKEPGFDNFINKETFANEPDEVYKDIDAVINPPSNGINEPTKSYPATAGGDNPMNVKTRLESLYNQIKNR
jgi:hypothetical protein